MVDLSQFSDEELQAALAQAPQAQPDVPVEQKLGNMARAASQNVITGLQTASVQPGLLLRDITDSIGITDPKVSEEIRNTVGQYQDAATSNAEALGAPTAGTIGRVIGEGAPMLAEGMMGYSAAKGLLFGAGRVADTAASALSSAGQSLLADTGGDVVQRVENASKGALLGGAIGGVSNVLGAAGSAITGVKDPLKVAAFREAGIKPRMSQVISKELSPKAQRFWEGVEVTLNKIPVFGIQGKVKNAAYKLADKLKSTVDDIDNGNPDPGPLFQKLKESADQTKAYELQGVQKTIQSELDSFSKNPAIARSDNVKKYIEGLTGLKNRTFGELHEVRQGIDGKIASIKKNLTDPATREDFSALARIRNSVNDELTNIARDQKFLKPWKEINKAYQDHMFAQGFVEAKKAAEKAGGEIFNAKVFNEALENNLDELKNTYKIKIPEQYKIMVRNTKKLSDLFTADKVKPVAPGLNLSAAGAGTLALAGVGGLGYATGDWEGAGVSAALLGGLSLLATSKTGVNMISSLGDVSSKNPQVRQLAATALALHFAEKTREHKQGSQEVLSTLSDEELQQILQQAQPQQGGQ